MQKLLLFCALALFSGGLFAQPLFVDQFDDGTLTTGDTDKWDLSEENGELLIQGNGTNGAWDIVYYGLGSTLDLSANAKVYVRAKSSAIGTQLRVDLADTNEANTMTAPQTITLTDEYRTVELDFGSIDVGSVDLSVINAMYFFVNGGTEGFTGSVAIDFISIGEEPAGTLMSEIYQDQMDSDSSLTNWTNEVPGFVRERNEDGADPSYVTFVGDGTAGPWTPHVYTLRPAPEYIETSIDMTDNPKMFVKMRTSVPGTAIRFDVQDTDNIASIGNAITRIITSEWVVYEYDYTDAFQNFVNEACPTADVTPCDVNLEAISQLLVFVNGGTGQFAGTIDIDWISFGTNLDGAGPEALLEYSDEFDNDRVDWTGAPAGVDVTETGGSMFLTGDGTSEAFASVTYDFNEPTDDQDTVRIQRSVDFGPEAGQGKVFIRARTAGGDHPLRIDLIDTSGLATNLVGLTKRITPEWTVYTYDFTGNYGDAGYGGAEGCTPEMPCFIDESTVQGLFFYVRPGEGLFNGQIEIDWVSVGQPLEEQEATEPGVTNYSDTLVGSSEFFTESADGIEFSVSEDGIVTISGDGSSSPFQQVQYFLRDDEGNASKADAAGSGDRLFVRARIRNAESAELRVDLVDEQGFETTNAGAANTVTGEAFATYEYNYAGNYSDGGYGGTACPQTNGADPCPVDPERITQINFYPTPGDGMFNGDIDINWISFGQEISVNVNDFAELDALRIFPNPADDRIGVEYTLPVAGLVSVSLFDGLGRRVLTRDFGQRAAGNNFHALDVAELATGTYYLQVAVNGVPTRAQTVLKR